MGVFEDLNGARGLYYSARGALEEALWDVSQKELALAAAQRQGSGVAEAQAELDQARVTLESKRTDEASRKQALRDQYALWVPATLTPEDEVARLAAGIPLVLLPVRLETRFAGTTLKVRVYPDEIFSDALERRLTPVEVEWGRAYLTERDANPEDVATRKAAWRRLLERFPAARAAFIVKTLDATAEPPLRSGDWTRAVLAELLPDRWTFVGYPPGGGTPVRVVGPPIEEPLALSLNPSAKENATPPVGLPDIEPELRWTMDFEAAKTAGMAVEMPVGAAGFARLLVFGVKSSIAPADSSRALSRLFESHHHTRGFSLVKQGTPTNNTTDRPAGYPVDDPNGEESFRVEQSAALDGPGTDGRVVTGVLGLDRNTMGHVAGAERTEQVNAAAMNRALWPATWGVFLQQMMLPLSPGSAPNFTRPVVQEAESFFVGAVRGRGSCPALRIGAVPYGVQPVSSLSRWVVDSDAVGTERQLPPRLALLRALWLSRVGQVARVRRNPDDADGDLVRVLGTSASSREVRVRTAMGEGALWNWFQLRRRPWAPASAALNLAAAMAFSRIGEGWLTKVGRLTLKSYAPRFKQPLVGPDPLREDRDVEGNVLLDPSQPRPPGPINYVDRIRLASIADLKTGFNPRPPALLYHVLRQAMLYVYAEAASVKAAVPLLFMIHEIHLSFAGTLGPFIWNVLEGNTQFPPGTTIPMETYLKQHDPDVGVYHSALAHLATLPEAEMDRLFSETLDLASHRLDAWITALYVRRLSRQRPDVYGAPDPYNPYGQPLQASNHLGAFAWVEDLTPKPPGAQAGGYIHTPSLGHAAAAAILRNGFLTYNDEPDRRFAVDLSSRRVRRARTLLDAVREGLPAAEILGNQFERALHDSGLDKFIDPIRRHFPLVANRAGGTGLPPPETIAARTVVHGLELRKLFTAAGGVANVLALSGVPSASAAERTALERALTTLDEDVDAVADLLTAESVYQLTRGNMSAAAAPLDTLGEGVRPPDPEIARTPRGGVAITHRLSWLFGTQVPLAGPWKDIASTPRASAEPLLDDWVGVLLGAPARIKGWVTHTAGGTPPSPQLVTPTTLGLRPLDFLELARDQAGARQELERRMLRAAFGDAPVPASAKVEFTPPAGQPFNPATELQYPQALDLALEIGKALGEATLLRPRDLLPLDHKSLTDADDPDVPATDRPTLENDTAAFDLGPTLQSLLDDLEAASTDAQIRTQLRAAASYLPGVFPDPRADRTALDGARAAAVAALEERLARVDAALGIVDQLEQARELYRAAFGRDFLRLPRFTLPALFGDEITTSVASRSGPTFTPRPLRFLQQAARVRAGVGAWRKLWLFAEAGGAPRPLCDVAQIPHVPNEAWAGDAGPPAGSRLSLLLPRFVPGALPDWSEPVAGLMFDEWTEVIPNRHEQTGLALHYDNPGAEAAQGILVAVHPNPEGRASWALADVEATLNETLDLAKLRAVDLEHLGELGQVLPAIYFTSNAEGHTISTDYSDLVESEYRIVRRSV